MADHRTVGQGTGGDFMPISGGGIVVRIIKDLDGTLVKKRDLSGVLIQKTQLVGVLKIG